MIHTATQDLTMGVEATLIGTTRLLPFSVGFHVSEVRVRLMSGSSEPAVLDFGVRDPLRIRGWSGGARDHCYIGIQSATPGYIWGPLPEGEWSVMLGFYKLPSQPFTLTVPIEVDTWTPEWIPGDLHVHTEHSDGSWSLSEVLTRAHAMGLKYIALTDHNTSSQNQALAGTASPIIAVPGMEWTTAKGHANIWGLTDPLPDWTVAHAQELVQKRGLLSDQDAMISINHPFDQFAPGIAWDWSMEGFPAVEIWNGPWRPSNQQAVNWWEKALRGGDKVVAVGGSDVHGPSEWVQLGHPVTWVYAEKPGAAGVVDAIKRGHVFITDQLEAPRAQFAEWLLGDTRTRPEKLPWHLAGLSAGERVRLVSTHGVLVEVTASHDTMSGMALMDPDVDWVRLEVHRWHREWECWMPRLMTNPIYFISDRGAS